MSIFKEKEKQNHWVGMRLTDDRVYLTQVQRNRDEKPLVDFVHIEQMDTKKPEALKKLFKKHQLKSKQCSLVLDSMNYQLLHIQKPNVPEEEQREAVRWSVKDLLDYPVEDATMDFLEIPADPASPNRQTFIYAISAKNTLIKEVSNRLTEAGVNLKAIDIKVAAQRNISTLLESNDRGVAMLSISSTGVLLTFTAGGDLYHARFIEIEEDRTVNAFERIALELQRSLDHFERQYPYVIPMKLFIAPFEGRDAFVAYLRTAIYQSIDTFELMDVFDFSDQDSVSDLSTQASLIPVLGASLRQEVHG